MIPAPSLCSPRRSGCRCPLGPFSQNKTLPWSLFAISAWMEKTRFGMRCKKQNVDGSRPGSCPARLCAAAVHRSRAPKSAIFPAAQRSQTGSCPCLTPANSGALSAGRPWPEGAPCSPGCAGGHAGRGLYQCPRVRSGGWRGRRAGAGGSDRAAGGVICSATAGAAGATDMGAGLA